MYQSFFGFRERPFQLVPDPAYLFLSQSHEEAMAHLTYALREGEGFIVITGEVGTGKTTLCRAFMEGLDDSCETAYVFNPKLSAEELLQTICDDFEIAPPTSNSIKALIDALNRFLMEKKVQGKKVLLLIDEAQNLGRDVLEQIRLLSNLETTKEKLLQIVLVGQPEMEVLLASHSLRQLNQRITLRCRLAALTFPETTRYVRHRLHLASEGTPPEFTPGALRRIQAYSGGIPRLIHVVCDRALLVAFGKSQYAITGSIVRDAVRELTLGRNRLKRAERRNLLLLGLLLVMAAALIFLITPKNLSLKGLLATHPRAVSLNASGGDRNAGNKSPEKKEALPAPGPSDSPLAALLPREEKSMETAITSVLALWKGPAQVSSGQPLAEPETYFRKTAEENGGAVHPVTAPLSLLKQLNLPAIFEFRTSGSDVPVFLPLVRTAGEDLVFIVGGKEMPFHPEALDGLWTGKVYIPWINFEGLGGLLPLSGSREDILLLKGLLANVGYPLSPDPVYDPETADAVKAIQRKCGLPEDGLVGPLTKMALYNQQPNLPIPHLQAPSGKTPGTEKGAP